MRYVAAALSVVCVGLFVWLQAVQRQKAVLADDVAALRRSNAALLQQAAQSRLARDVEAARVARYAALAAELQADIDQIKGIPDAPLHPHLIRLFDPAGR